MHIFKQQLYIFFLQDTIQKHTYYLPFWTYIRRRPGHGPSFIISTSIDTCSSFVLTILLVIVLSLPLQATSAWPAANPGHPGGRDPASRPRALCPVALCCYFELLIGETIVIYPYQLSLLILKRLRRYYTVLYCAMLDHTRLDFTVLCLGTSSLRHKSID